MISSRSIIAIPPGATIKEQLNDRGMSQKEFAARMDMSEKHISRLINGEVQLTPDMAVRLETVLGVPARFWSNLEAAYREKIAKAKAENSLEKDTEIAARFPYGEMSRLGWVPQTNSSKERAANLRKYFEVAELDLLEDSRITNIACRRLAITEKSDLALIAWAQEAKIIARDIETWPVNIKGLKYSVPYIREMTAEAPEDFFPELEKILAEHGIALVVLPHLKGSFLHGATFIDGKKIVTGLTARGRDADKFWFSLFHELGHITLGHIGLTGGTTDEDEKKADAWAADALIDPGKFKIFTETGDFSRQSVIEFAAKQRIAPGIVVGRLQRERMIKYNVLNDLKEKYVISITEKKS
ncbi:MAG: HigA family addiction module antitoxin [Anaerovoracaceae bacterium]|jgi:HTH-type transcriptional regulator/antitoxin HigA